MRKSSQCRISPVCTVLYVCVLVLFSQCAVAEGKVISSYELYGHRQTSNTECPGQHFYETIQSYPHWVSSTKR